MVNYTGQIKTRSGSIAAFCPQQCNTFILFLAQTFLSSQAVKIISCTRKRIGCVLPSKGSDLFCLIVYSILVTNQLHPMFNVDLTLQNPSQSCVWPGWAGDGGKNWPTKCNFHISIFVSENPLV